MYRVLLEQYIDRESKIHLLDARTKLLFTLLFIFVVVICPPGRWLVFSVYFIAIAILVLISNLPVYHILKRSLIIIPFVGMIAVFMLFFRDGETVYSLSIWKLQMNITNQGILLLKTILVRAWLSVLGLIWLTSVTKITSLLHALKQLHFPNIMVMIIAFMYRYIFVIFDEMQRMKLAMDCRRINVTRMQLLRGLGNIIGTLFIRSYERSEQVYSAMLARGFEGEFKIMAGPSVQRADLIFITCSGSLLIFITVTAYFL